MTTILKRVYQILNAYRGSISRSLRSRENDSDVEFDEEDYFSRTSGPSNTVDDTPRFDDYPKQIVEDLANFNLKPPSTLAEVKKARNQEILKFHPDRFMSDPARRETANEILQIYNASYERLKKFFQSQSS